jgi:exopolysaccharide biosynthesis polyprenyl glycosylphosphotransferase
MSLQAPTLELAGRPDQSDGSAVRNRASSSPRRRSGSGRLGRVLVATDLVAGGLGWFLVGPIVLAGSRQGPMLTVLVVAAVLTTVSMAGLGLYRSVICVSRPDEVVRVVLAVGCTLAVLLALERAGYVQVDGVEAFWVGAASVVCLLIGRSGYRSWVTAARIAGRFRRPLVLIGQPAEVQALATFYDEHPALGYDVVGVVSDEPDGLPPTLPWIGAPDDDAALDAVSEVGGAVLALGGLPSSQSNRLLRRLSADGVRVHLHTGLSRISHRRFRALDLAHEPLQYLDPVDGTTVRDVAKRALDLAGATVVLVLTAPLLAAVAVAIKLDDGGPVLFRQSRVGAGGREFTMLKLRSMVVDAEARRQELLDQNLRKGPLFKADVDPRITRVGRVLRATSIDELPQLVNVLRGDMSLVGPRPALAAETEQFDDELRRSRALVRPGMTGLWQVEAGDSPSIYLYRRLDLYYVENWTIGGDLSILLRTAATVVVRGVQRLRRGERR